MKTHMAMWTVGPSRPMEAPATMPMSTAATLTAMVRTEKSGRRLRRLLPRLYAEGGAQGLETGPQDCAVLLVSPGSQALQVIAALCKLAGISPQQAKNLAADAPMFVLDGIDRAKAEEAKKTLAGLGAAAEVW